MKEEPIDWPKIVFGQIQKVLSSEYPSRFDSVRDLEDTLVAYWDNDKDWDKQKKDIDDTYKNMIKDVHNPPTDADMKKIAMAEKDRCRALYRALMKLIHNSTGLMPHKEVEGIIDEYRPSEASVQEAE